MPHTESIPSTSSTGGPREILQSSPTASTSARAFRQETPSTAPESSSHAKQRTRIQRACDTCRDKRLKCEYERGSTTCLRCQKSSLICQAIRPAPNDDRPRAKRLRSKKARAERIDNESSVSDGDGTSDDSQYRSQGLEPRYLAVLVGRGTAESDDRPKVKRRRGLSKDVGATDHTQQNLAESVLKEGVIQSLIHSYRLNILPLSPILSLAELCSIEPSLGYAIQSEDIGPPPPNPLPNALTRLAVCTLAALSRQVPRHIYHSLFARLTVTLNGAEGSRLMRTSSLGNVQVLLLLSSSAEMHSSNTDQGGGLSWLRSGLAIRMAQDIGLHREIAQNTIPIQQINRRRRIWAACIISDRWYAISFGRPMAINLFDCDAAGPSIYADDVGPGLKSKEAPFQVHAEIAKLSVILGRVIRYCYSPLGMDITIDGQLQNLSDDLVRWRHDLPSNLKFELGAKAVFPGLLHLLATCVDFLFLRAFMKPIKPIPSQLIFRPEAKQWQDVVTHSAEAIKWCAAEGAYYLDTWFPVMYSLAWCFIVQLHSYVERRSPDTLVLLQLAESSLRQWAASVSDEPNSDNAMRVKVLALVSLLSSAALRMSEPTDGSVPIPDPMTFPSSAFSNLSGSPADQFGWTSSINPMDPALGNISESLPSFGDDLSILNQFFFGPQESSSFQSDQDFLNGIAQAGFDLPDYEYGPT
ncbi:uncharacterized protein I303_108099 [Kwoniella dejecticola CBS 10117]|uniref:Zn(2)-C6 fungal-type domain-containing protein n=1 Tax=Kwoniella dejecticola CBS 10117 TaxID=1296121 RepID=A0AAJ8MKG8_9TREE